MNAWLYCSLIIHEDMKPNINFVSPSLISLSLRQLAFVSRQFPTQVTSWEGEAKQAAGGDYW